MDTKEFIEELAKRKNISGQIAQTGCQCRGGESLNEIHKEINGCEVTITFKGHNPDIKDIILNLLCDSFEEKVRRQTDFRSNKEKVS